MPLSSWRHGCVGRLKDGGPAHPQDGSTRGDAPESLASHFCTKISRVRALGIIVKKSDFRLPCEVACTIDVRALTTSLTDLLISAIGQTGAHVDDIPH
ncbi:hypothetical protein VYU27_007427 [Nannochloropsis oceanica]